MDHVGKKTVGYATREGANVEIVFEAAKSGDRSRRTAWLRKDRWQFSRTLMASSSRALHCKWIQR